MGTGASLPDTNEAIEQNSNRTDAATPAPAFLLTGSPRLQV